MSKPNLCKLVDDAIELSPDVAAMDDGILNSDTGNQASSLLEQMANELYAVRQILAGVQKDDDFGCLSVKLQGQIKTWNKRWETPDSEDDDE